MNQATSTTLIIGCGYLGKRVAQRLLKRGERVFGSTRSAEKAEVLARLGMEPILFDVNATTPIPNTDQVLYAVGFDRQSEQSRRAVLVDGLSWTLGRLSKKVRHVVYVGSTSVYGETDGEWVDEETIPKPTTEVGIIGLEAEQAISRSGLKSSILRFSGLYGSGRIIGRDALRNGKPIVGDPLGWLNLIEIDDAAEAAIAVLDRGRTGAIYLATDDRPILRREYYEGLAERLGVVEVRFADSSEKSSKRVSNRRLKSEFGLQLGSPDFEAGLTKAFAEESQ